MRIHRFVSRLAALTLAILTVAHASACVAEEDTPVAIRAWPDGGITIETMWGLQAGMGLSEEVKSSLDREIDLDISEMELGTAQAISRTPNAKEIKTAEGSIDFNNAKAISAVRAPLAESGEENADSPKATIVFTGLNLFINLNEVSSDQFLQALEIDSVKKGLTDLETKFGNSPVVIASHDSHDAAFCEKVIELLQPRLLIVNEKVKRIGEADVESISHNTVAVSRLVPDAKKPRFVSLSTTPYKMSDELAAMFEAKETASAKSQAMFAKLSVAQMNFKPENGSHTPRWNAEHMMGRELLFFSQIYHTVDPSIPVMDLNPKQMPKDYKFAHADWNGTEEALQMQRVQSFTRRFAYLLDGMELGARAKGSRWPSLRALLKQMDRHYGEHSANVIKKMELDNWPKE